MFTKENHSLFLSILSSLLVAGGVGVLVYFAKAVTGASILFYIALITAVLSILFVVFSAFCSRRNCHCLKNSYLPITTIASIVIIPIALSVTLSDFIIPAAVLIGVITFLLVMNLIEIVKLILCTLCERECCN